MHLTFWFIVIVIIYLIPLVLGMFQVIPWKGVGIAYAVLLAPIGIIILVFWALSKVGGGKSSSGSSTGSILGNSQPRNIRPNYGMHIPTINQKGVDFITGRRRKQ
jgi:hypothetical protein